MRSSPQFALTSAYHTGNQVAALLRGHVAAALKLLGSPRPSGPAIHAARQELKRARAVLRLLRESIDPENFREEDAALRGAAQQLNEARDAEVVYRVFVRLQRDVHRDGRRPNLAPLRELLDEERHSAAATARRQPLTTARTLLLQARERTRTWSVKNDMDELAKALRRTYRRGRSCYRAARQSRSEQDLHAWRRQVKYSAYQLEALGALVPPKASKRLRRCVKLAKVLGRDHDLAMLSRQIGRAPLAAAASLSLTDAIRRERARLQRRALQLGERLYGVKPRKFQPLRRKHARGIPYAAELHTAEH